MPKIVKVAAACFNSNGEPDLFFARFLLSNADADPETDEYLPYLLVDRLAEREGYEPAGWRVTDLDPSSSVLGLCHWHTVPVRYKDLAPALLDPMEGSIWYEAETSSHWMIYSSSKAADPVVHMMELTTSEDTSEELDRTRITGREYVGFRWSELQPKFGHMIYLPPDVEKEN